MPDRELPRIPLDRSQYLVVAEMDDGTGDLAAVEPLLLGQGQVIRTPDDNEGLKTDEWMYPTLFEARLAFLAWMIAPEMPEPQGWVRHKSSATGRTRRRAYEADGGVREWEDQP